MRMLGPEPKSVESATQKSVFNKPSRLVTYVILILKGINKFFKR